MCLCSALRERRVEGRYWRLLGPTLAREPLEVDKGYGSPIQTEAALQGTRCSAAVIACKRTKSISAGERHFLGKNPSLNSELNQTLHNKSIILSKSSPASTPKYQPTQYSPRKTPPYLPPYPCHLRPRPLTDMFRIPFTPTPLLHLHSHSLALSVHLPARLPSNNPSTFSAILSVKSSSSSRTLLLGERYISADAQRPTPNASPPTAAVPRPPPPCQCAPEYAPDHFPRAPGVRRRNTGYQAPFRRIPSGAGP